MGCIGCSAVDGGGDGVDGLLQWIVVVRELYTCHSGHCIDCFVFVWVLFEWLGLLEGSLVHGIQNRTFQLSC